jgi:hypothetical protein
VVTILLQIEDNRLEAIWPIYKRRNNNQDEYVCTHFSDFEENRGIRGEALHGSIVANLAAGKSYGAAPKAKVVLVNKPSGGPEAGHGIGLAYRAILEHYRTLGNGTHAILNISAGSTASTIQYSIDSLPDLAKLLEARILIVSAAGNRADNHPVRTHVANRADQVD